MAKKLSEDDCSLLGLAGVALIGVASMAGVAVEGSEGLRDGSLVGLAIDAAAGTAYAANKARPIVRRLLSPKTNNP